MDAATSSRSTRDRAAAADTTSGPSGELIPVLMRIPDVRPPARGKAKRETVAKETAAKESVATLSPAAAANSSANDTYEPSFEIGHLGDAQKEKTVHLETPSRETEVATSQEAASQKTGAERAVDSVAAAAKETPPAAEDANELPPPKEAAEPTTTNRRQRQRRTTTGPKPSWWKTQGRAIAVVFVAALGLTIYLARVQPGKTSDTAREDEVTEIDISSSAVTDDTLDAVRPGHSSHVASKPKTSVPPLADHDSHDEDQMDEAIPDLDAAEEADSSLASAEADSDTESEASTGIDWGDLPEYPRTPEDKYPSDGPLPRTAKTPNSSSTR